MQAACALGQEGLIEITQKGRVLAPVLPLRGAVRLRLKLP